MSTASKEPDYRALLKRAYSVVETLQSQLDAQMPAKEPIAIIGMGCRFPGDADHPDAFWDLLHNGIDTVTEVPPDRWDVDAYYDPDPDAPGKTYARWGAFLKGVDRFDADFFGITPREALAMDPQQRLLLEVTWEALEHAGCAPTSLAGSRSGVFLGLTTNDYGDMQKRYGSIEEINAYTSTGTVHSIAAGRLSYFLGLQGPSMAVDTACSSSLVAVHLAAQSLRAGECGLAVAGGTNLCLLPEGAVATSRARMLSFDGRCKTFDASADGYVRGEGCGMIVLKRLSDAIAARDNVLAVIIGSALNQDGRSNGLTAPNGRAQEAVFRAALADAKIQPGEVGYVEAHGTGTSLGDPIELRALASVYGEGRPEGSPLRVGSVKTNVGHLEAGAGIVSLIKVVLALQHGTIPPHLHLREPNPHVPWDHMPLVVPTEPEPWPTRAGKRRIAGVSSFGFSGTNAHMIVAEAPRPEPVPATVERPLQILGLSAKSEAALMELGRRYEQMLAGAPEEALPDICYTANAGRAHFTERLAVVAGSIPEARAQLTAWLAGEADGAPHRGSLPHTEPPEIVFLFTGQGAQYAGMGAQLYQTQPVFRDSLDRCAEILRPYLDRPLREVMWPETGNSALLDETIYTQPALFALEYALATLWRAWGIEPAAVAGHSVGEYVAACVAGVFSLEDGLKLIATRGRLMQSLPPGGRMAAIFAGEARVEEALAPYRDRVSIAAINGPQTTVISGEGSAVQAILDTLANAGIKARRLNVSHAFHSPLMAPILDRFTEAATSINYAAPEIALISNVTGRLAGDEVATPTYWRQHIRMPVRFAGTMQSLYEAGYDHFLEIGPTPTLLGLGQRCLPENHGTWLPSLRKERDAWQQMLTSLATLYVRGAAIDWERFDHGYARRRVSVPTYPFQRHRYWYDTHPDRFVPSVSQRGTTLHPLLQQRVRSPLLKAHIFESHLGMNAPGFLKDHRIYETALVPATGYLEMGMAAAELALGEGHHAIEAFSIQEALILPEQGTRTVQVAVSEVEQGSASFQIWSLAEADNAWTQHATGTIRVDQEAHRPPAGVSPGTIGTQSMETLDVSDYYRQFTDIGVRYGPSFRSIVQLWRAEGEVWSRIELPETYRLEATRYQLYPPVLDACFQTLGAALVVDQEEASGRQAYLPIGLERFQLYRPGATGGWCRTQLRRARSAHGTLTADLSLFDDAGEPVADIGGLSLKQAEPGGLNRARAQRLEEWLYEIRWQSQPLPSQQADNGTAAGTWLIFADQLGIGTALAGRLEERGDRCLVIYAGRVTQQLDADRWEIDWRQREMLQQPVAEATGDSTRPYRGIIYLWALDSLPPETDDTPLPDQARTCGTVLDLIQALDDRLAETGPETARTTFCLVTCGAQPVAASTPSLSIEQTPLWGLGRTIAAEYPHLRTLCLDLDTAGSVDQVDALYHELLAQSDEAQVAVRGATRYVARLVRSESEPPATPPAEDGPVELEITTRGILDNLRLRSTTRQQPGPGEVEIRVRASGLNFRDVLNAMGMYPGEAGPLGSECAGTILTVGEGVTEFAPGDEVIALVAGGFKTHATAPAERVFTKPAELGFAEAVTLPITFLTAYYGLHHLANIQAGERVLIHAAAGGVGQAAVQLAKRAGAEIFGTAGSPEKRAFLKSVGVQHVMDSRSLDFADEIMAITGGEGVHIVLNSLADAFIPKSLSVLADGGRFLEIGKRGIWNAEQVAGLNSTLSYHAYDLSDVVLNDPACLRTMMAHLLEAFRSGELEPLPLRTFPLADAGEAFRFMAQAKHIGKIVLTQNHSDRSVAVRPDGSYLITGGLGGLGLQTAEWLVERGARHLVLMGRSAPSQRADETVARLEAAGAEVMVTRGDIAREEDVARVLATIKPPLRGIIHAAGIIEDRLLRSLSWDSFARVMAPKVDGGWHLHRLTAEMPLDFFVMFSSGSALLGSPGQGNYNSANAFLDGLAHYRQGLGLPALSINWGPWSEVGMATQLESEMQARWAARGIGFIRPEQGILALERLLDHRAAQVAVLPIDWPTVIGTIDGHGAQPLLREMIDGAKNSQPPAPSVAGALLSELASAAPAERYELIAAHIEEQANRVFGLPPSHSLNRARGLLDMGMDSLMAVELSNRLQTTIERALPTTLAFEYPTIDAIAGYLLAEVLDLEMAAGPVGGSEQAEGEQREHLVEVQQLTEDEAEDSLLEELKRGGY